MTKQSSHTRWKGCPLCKPHKDRRFGDSFRTKFSARRAMGMPAKRGSRHVVG